VDEFIALVVFLKGGQFQGGERGKWEEKERKTVAERGRRGFSY
jgi:hypothetical protein